ncbi:RDD family protein [Ramlibacter rhizophilus]|uniref:RDD family protein n=1 Tax=Ramlibacter rhizophilus TaxID=1781167 RepID=A0A4Z0C2I3_9BURK|nr:RDD family protein [Ramlibacter rhizophilus]TFZ04718.1 RDD family protein [Ramlibacter rhizophilus]
MSDNTTDPAGTERPRPCAPDELQAPGLWRRMACWLYEGVLLFGVVVAAGLVFSIATQMRHALMYREALIAFLFLVIGAYFVWCWTRGETLAMRTWRIRVVDRHGRRLHWGRAALRYVFSLIWLLPPLAAFGSHQVALGPLMILLVGWVAVWALLSRFHPQRQFWHDAWAGTRLVPAPPRG